MKTKIRNQIQVGFFSEGFKNFIANGNVIQGMFSAVVNLVIQNKFLRKELNELLLSTPGYSTLVVPKNEDIVNCSR